MLNLLFSDYIFMFILAIIAYGLVKVLQDKQQKRMWAQLFHSATACCSFVIVMFFLIISTLDSIHFKENGNYYSVLDELIQPIGQFDEKTFSEPMALKSFAYETKSVAGNVTRFQPKLQHVKGRSPLDNLLNLLLDLTYALLLLVTFITIINWRQGQVNNFGRWLQNKPGEVARSAITYSCFLVFCLLFICKDFASHYFLLGTDKIGLDVFYLVLKSVRTGMAIGLITILFMVPLAALMGISAGYFGGRIDSIVQYIYTTLSSIPGVLLISAAVLSLDMFMYKNSAVFSDITHRADVRLLALCFILGLTGWTSLCRLLRGEVLKIRELDFILQAKVVGVSNFKIMYKHILPNVMHIIIITSVLDFSGLVLAEAVLSYLGVGVDPTMHSWGNIINSARLELARDPVVWWPLFGAVLAMFLLVLSVNLLADKARNLRDPRRL